MASTKYAAIPEPEAEVENLREVVTALKQTVEVLSRQRGGAVRSAAVTWQDLVDLELIEATQVPKR
jgi:hypothetical protein